MDLVSFRDFLKALSCLLLELNKERRMEGGEEGALIGVDSKATSMLFERC